MTLDADIKVRTQRLLDGRATSRDLERLFSWLRFRDLGYQAVRDIGDFANHLEERTKGHAYEALQRFEDILLYVTPRIQAHGTGKRAYCDKATLQRGAIAMLNERPPSEVKAETGLRKDKAQKALKKALAKIVSYDGTFTEVSEPLTAREDAVVQYATSVLSFPITITDDQLIKEFAECLAANHLITRSQAPGVLAQKDKLSVFAVEKMHLAKVNLPSGRSTVLHAGLHNEHIAVTGILKVPFMQMELQMCQFVFSTSCPAEQWCVEELLSRGEFSWEMPIEIGPDGRLRALT